MLVRTRKTLANATLSGGARIAAAGGGLPQRITTPADRVLANVAELRAGVVFDPGGAHVWVNARTSNEIRKVRISDGVTVSTLSAGVGALPENMSRALGSTKAYVAGAGTNTALEVDLIAGTVTTFTSPTASPYHVVQGSAGKAWVRSTNASSAAYTEFTLATGVATGRTIANSWSLVYDATNAKIYQLAATGAVQRLAEATLAVELTWAAPSTAAHSVPRYGSSFRELVVDSARRPIVADTSTGSVYRYQSGADAIDRRLFMGSAEFGVPATSSQGTARFQRQFMAFSDDDAQAAWLQYNSTGASISDALDVRVMQLGTARARWSFAAATPLIVKEVSAGGSFGNIYEAVITPPAGQPTAAYDYRRTRWFYSTDGGTNRTEFTPGDDLTIAVASGGALTVDADMKVWELPLPTLAPWIGGSSGEGISMVALRPRARERFVGVV